jgi:hypothetical protein
LIHALESGNRKDDMKTDLHIAARLQKLLDPLTKEERKQLKANIVSDGAVFDPILFWDDGKKDIVIDGMHRWEIVRNTNIPYDTREMAFRDYEEAEVWILDHQLGQRNLLKPAAIRKIRGELYNRWKRDDKGHGVQKAGGQNVPPVQSAAEKVAEKAGVSAKTVKRDGARVEAIANLSKHAQAIAEKATDAEVKALAKLDTEGQQKVARAVRTAQASSVKEAIKQVKPPKPSKPPKQVTRAQWFKQWDQAMKPLSRLVDKISHEVGEPKCQSKSVIHDHLNIATEEMQEWMGVEK